MSVPKEAIFSSVNLHELVKRPRYEEWNVIINNYSMIARLEVWLPIFVSSLSFVHGIAGARLLDLNPDWDRI